MTTLGTSTLACFLVNSWTTVWILLEMNTMAFCSLMFTKFSSEMKNTKESMMKYFIIQSISSALLIMSAISLKSEVFTSKLLVMMTATALMIKAASAPVHQWFISLAKKMNWATNFVLFTWQKLAPMFLMIYQTKMILLPFLLASATMGATTMVNKCLIKEIMALSSVFNLSWMILTISMNTSVFLAFTAMYWTALSFLLKTLIVQKAETLSKSMTMKPKAPLLLLMFMNLAGLPPLVGFLAKWVAFSMALTLKMKLLATLLLIISAINLFVYLRMINPTNMKDTENMTKTPNITSTPTAIVFVMINTTLMAFMIT